MDQPISKAEDQKDLQLLATFLGSNSSESERAFAQLVSRHGGYVRAIAQRRLGQSGLSDDATQHVFLLLAKKAKKLRGHPCLRAWLHRASVFEAANLARKEVSYQKKKERVQVELSQRVESRELSQLDEALAHLSTDERSLLVLHYHEGLTFTEIGKRIGISEAAAQKRAHRVLTKLSEKMSLDRKKTKSATACASLLVGTRAQGESLSPGLVEKIVTSQSIAGSSIALTSVVVGLTLVTTAVGVGVTSHHRERKAVAALAQKPPRIQQEQTRESGTKSGKGITTAFEVSQEELSPEVIRFIELALEDEKEAFSFAKSQSRGLDRFLAIAVRPLADRDLEAADRFLELVEGRDAREHAVQGIFESRIKRDFQEAVRWVDELPYEFDKIGHRFGRPGRYKERQGVNYDYVAALSVAETASVREWLIEQACERALVQSEEQLPLLANQLSGAERHQVLSYWASVLLQRGQPGAFELMEEARPNLIRLPNLKEIAQRDPEPLLNWSVSKKDGVNRYNMILDLVRDWGETDAEAAADWWASVPDLRYFVSYSEPPSTPVVKRILRNKKS